jgi:hypothetical protein
MVGARLQRPGFRDVAPGGAAWTRLTRVLPAAIASVVHVRRRVISACAVQIVTGGYFK